MSSNRKSVRLIRHLFTTERQARRHFPKSLIAALAAAIERFESTHCGRLVFVVEAALQPSDVLKDITPRDRALQLFSELRVWDTAQNNGILVYVMVADRAIEIVADRAIHLRTGELTWQRIMGEMQTAFAAGSHEEGAHRGIAALAEELGKHFPVLTR